MPLGWVKLLLGFAVFSNTFINFVTEKAVSYLDTINVLKFHN